MGGSSSSSNKAAEITHSSTQVKGSGLIGKGRRRQGGGGESEGGANGGNKLAHWLVQRLGGYQEQQMQLGELQLMQRLIEEEEPERVPLGGSSCDIMVLLAAVRSTGVQPVSRNYTVTVRHVALINHIILLLLSCCCVCVVPPMCVRWAVGAPPISRMCWRICEA